MQVDPVELRQLSIGNYLKELKERVFTSDESILISKSIAEKEEERSE